MLAWCAARPPARSRGWAWGSGRPERAPVVSSRLILVKTLARFLSCAPFRYMMFLNCEWPAMSRCGSLSGVDARRRRSPAAGGGLTIQYGRIGAPPAPPLTEAEERHATLGRFDLLRS